jgi:hypothetical protein
MTRVPAFVWWPAGEPEDGALGAALGAGVEIGPPARSKAAHAASAVRWASVATAPPREFDDRLIAVRMAAANTDTR